MTIRDLQIELQNYDPKTEIAYSQIEYSATKHCSGLEPGKIASTEGYIEIIICLPLSPTVLPLSISIEDKVEFGEKLG